MPSHSATGVTGGGGAPSIPPRVLVIDDDPIALETIRELLTTAGFDVLTRQNAALARSTAVSEHVDAVVCDAQMQRTTGDEVAQAFADDEKLRALPMVLVSANGARLEASVRAMGWLRTLTKRQIAQLPDVLYRALASRRQLAPIRRSAPPKNSGVRPRIAQARMRLQQRFFDSMKTRLEDGKSLWMHFHEDAEASKQLRQLIHTLEGEAQMLVPEGSVVAVLEVCGRIARCNVNDPLVAAQLSAALARCVGFLQQADVEANTSQPACFEAAKALVEVHEAQG